MTANHPALKLIAHYPSAVVDQVKQLIDAGRLQQALDQRYPQKTTAHQIRSSKALYQYTQALKQEFMRQSQPIAKVEFSDKVPAVNALGVHVRSSRVQGNKLKSKKAIYIDSRFRDFPEPLLRMIVVHELAHLREMDHNKAFYKLCEYMAPDYHQLEFDLRLFLIAQSLSVADK